MKSIKNRVLFLMSCLTLLTGFYRIGAYSSLVPKKSGELAARIAAEKAAQTLGGAAAIAAKRGYSSLRPSATATQRFQRSSLQSSFGTPSQRIFSPQSSFGTPRSFVTSYDRETSGFLRSIDNQHYVDWLRKKVINDPQLRTSYDERRSSNSFPANYLSILKNEFKTADPQHILRKLMNLMDYFLPRLDFNSVPLDEQLFIRELLMEFDELQYTFWVYTRLMLQYPPREKRLLAEKKFNALVEEIKKNMTLYEHKIEALKASNIDMHHLKIYDNWFYLMRQWLHDLELTKKFIPKQAEVQAEEQTENLNALERARQEMFSTPSKSPSPLLGTIRSRMPKRSFSTEREAAEATVEPNESGVINIEAKNQNDIPASLEKEALKELQTVMQDQKEYLKTALQNENVILPQIFTSKLDTSKLNTQGGVDTIIQEITSSVSSVVEKYAAVSNGSIDLFLDELGLDALGGIAKMEMLERLATMLSIYKDMFDIKEILVGNVGPYAPYPDPIELMKIAKGQFSQQRDALTKLQNTQIEPENQAENLFQSKLSQPLSKPGTRGFSTYRPTIRSRIQERPFSTERESIEGASKPRASGPLAWKKSAVEGSIQYNIDQSRKNQYPESPTPSSDQTVIYVTPKNLDPETPEFEEVNLRRIPRFKAQLISLFPLSRWNDGAIKELENLFIFDVDSDPENLDSRRRFYQEVKILAEQIRKDGRNASIPGLFEGKVTPPSWIQRLKNAAGFTKQDVGERAIRAFIENIDKAEEFIYRGLERQNSD